MPLTTNGFPFPASTDRPDVVRDIRALAEAVDGKMPRVWVGEVTVNLNNVNNALAPPKLFPPGTFTAPPQIVAMPKGTTVYSAFQSSNDASGFVIGVRHIPGTNVTATVRVGVIAVQA